MINIEFENYFNTLNFSSRKRREFSKFFSSLKSEATTGLTKCVICGRECSSFCKSHSIPAFVLRQIASNGKIMVGSDNVLPFDDKHGVSNTLTFSCICSQCDNEYFQEYENPDILSSDKVNDVCINEIAVKCYLRHYYKRLKEQKIFEYLLTNAQDSYSMQRFSNKLLTTQLDITDVERRINKILKKKDEHNFYLIDEINLDYKVELAYQGAIALSQGFDGQVNELNNYNPKYKIEQLYLCVFPLKNKSKILVFCEEGSKRMKRFYKGYRKLSLDEKLYALNYIILLYEEEWCTSADFDRKKLNVDTLKIINQMTDIAIQTNNANEYNIAGKQMINNLSTSVFEIKTSGNIYNFLEKHQ